MRIRRGLGSRRLPCGCVAGVYETYRDEVVTIVDAANPRCADAAHQAGNVIPDATAGYSDRHASRRGRAVARAVPRLCPS